MLARSRTETAALDGERYAVVRLIIYSSMAILISLLRGVNLGGRNKIRMEALRRVYTSLGLEDVKTCLQSGNVVFRSRSKNLPQLARRIEDALEQAFEFRPAVVLRTADELEAVVAANPFAGRPGIDGAKLLVTFLAAEPDERAREALANLPPDSEEVHLRGRELYGYYPDGVGRPKVPYVSVEKALGVTGTARNWNTTTKLLELARGL